MRLSLTPIHAVLALLVGAALVLLAGVALYTDATSDRAQAAEGEALAAAASGLSTALEPGSDVGAALDELVRREELAGALFLDPVGRVIAQSAGRRLDGIDWNAALPPPADVQATDHLIRRAWQGEVYWMASAPTVDGRRVVLLRATSPDRSPVAWVLGIAAVLWSLVAVAAFTVLRLSRRPADQLEALARDLVRSDDVTAFELVQKRFDTRSHLGARARPLFALASDLLAARRRAADAQVLANAFMQVNPHYVLLCTLGGKVIDANPAFYARTNLMPEWLRGQPLSVLDATLPMEPLMELAARSKEENAAISGVPYALDIDGKQRAVDVALRTFPTAEGDTVLILLSDLTKERTLENQIDRYTDALDLMVDQRVAELTAGQDALDPLLDAAGLVVATFGRDGETQRFNASAERLTGRTAFTIRHFDDLARALFPDDEEYRRFTAWFGGAGAGTWQTAVPSPQGSRSLVWTRGEHRQAGEAVQRVLVGIEPAAAEQAASAASPRDLPPLSGLEPGGDGYAYQPERQH